MARRVVFWILTGAGLYLIVIMARGLWEVINSRSRVDVARVRAEELARKKQELEQKLVYVETDEFVEKEAREKLLLSRPGEKVVLLPPIATGSMALRREVDEKEEILVPWQQWARVFGFY